MPQPIHLLTQGLEGKAEARTWLLPMLRSSGRQARLSFWFSHLLPLARSLGSRAAAASGMQKLQCSALEAQLWACLPSFATWPHDGADAFR